MTLVDEIVAALEALGGIAKYSDLYGYLEKHSQLKIYPHSIRARIEENSSDSKAFKGSQDLFYSVKGLGSGVWGLRSKLPNSSLAVDYSQPDIDHLDRLGGAEPQRVDVKVTRIIRDTIMSRQLKMLYHSRCQICNSTICLHDRNYAEAHHLRPLGNPHKGIDEANNILVVCPNHHVEFDYGAIALLPNEKTIVHIDTHNTYMGKSVSFHPLHKISDLNLAYHIENVFKGD